MIFESQLSHAEGTDAYYFGERMKYLLYPLKSR